LGEDFEDQITHCTTSSFDCNASSTCCLSIFGFDHFERDLPADFDESSILYVRDFPLRDDAHSDHDL
jgi:hypothetical protein